MNATPVTAAPLTADSETLAEALAVLKACDGPGRRHTTLAGKLAATVEVVAAHGDDETARHMLRRALAWIAAETQVAAHEQETADRDFYSRTVEVEPARRTSRFVILPQDIDGFPVGGRWV